MTDRFEDHRLDKNTIHQLLEELNDELRKANAHAEICMVGGAVMFNGVRRRSLDAAR